MKFKKWTATVKEKGRKRAQQNSKLMAKTSQKASEINKTVTTAGHQVRENAQKKWEQWKMTVITDRTELVKLNLVRNRERQQEVGERSCKHRFTQNEGGRQQQE